MGKRKSSNYSYERNTEVRFILCKVTVTCDGKKHAHRKPWPHAVASWRNGSSQELSQAQHFRQLAWRHTTRLALQQGKPGSQDGALVHHVCFPLVALDLRHGGINRRSLSHVVCPRGFHNINQALECHLLSNHSSKAGSGRGVRMDELRTLMVLK